MLQQDDLILIEKKGITLKILENQLIHFREGFPFINLLRPAIVGDGIINFGEEKKKELIRFFEEQSPALRVLKFVPASGAASRMFKHLFEFRESLMTCKEIPESYFSDQGFNSAYSFFQNLHRFAFFHELQVSLDKQGKAIDRLMEEPDFAPVLDHLLSGEGLNYSSLPKALLAFHSYDDGPRTAMEEHLVEAAHYAKAGDGVSRIHFTVSPEHIERFDEKIAAVREKYETRFHTSLDISYSVQKSSTDIIAVDYDNNPFRNADGTLLFRPAGHGALLANLNEQEADLIFIKNIDNIVPDRLKPPTIEYKKLIGGLLLYIRKRIFDFLNKTESGNVTAGDIREMSSFAVSQKLLLLPDGFDRQSEKEQCRILIRGLNRPIRVCGMVRNTGEPGGGPFWVSGPDGKTTLQIVESSQVDLNDKRQTAIFRASTHFNPVDLVCCTIDHTGNPFNLQNFTDPSTGFISLKSSGGRILKAQELPGLWNGSMAGWITVFVEIPLITFNPVKTINDLLRDEHQ
jgi:hypothetical protein